MCVGQRLTFADGILHPTKRILISVTAADQARCRKSSAHSGNEMQSRSSRIGRTMLVDFRESASAQAHGRDFGLTPSQQRTIVSIAMLRRKLLGSAVSFGQQLLYLLPATVVFTLVCVTVFAYSWSSTLVDLVCSIQDDSFYYIIPSFNAAHGHGFTFGGEKTSGWQPLYELLLTFFSFFCNSLESVMRLALNLNGWLFALTAVVAGMGLLPLIKAALPSLRQSAVMLSMSVAVMSFACLHTVFFSSMTGKENALAAVLLATLIWRVFAPSRGIGDPLVVGILSGLLLLTRIAPSSIVYAGIAILLLEDWKSKFIGVCACLIPVVGWGVFSQRYFGHLLPMSMLVKMTSPNHLTVLREFRIGLEYLWESAKFALSGDSRFNLLQLQARDGIRSPGRIYVMAAALTISMLGLMKCLVPRIESRAVLALLMFNVASVLCNALFGAMQAGKSDDIYYSVWYVYDLPVLVAINCGFAVAWIQGQIGEMRFSRKATALLALAGLAYFAGDIAWYSRLRPYDVSDDAKFAGTWQIKKFEAAEWFLENVAPAHPNYRVAAYSAGALGFYLSDHVINLDGLANDAAGKALMSSRSAVAYAEQVKPDFLIEICRGEDNFDNLERLHVVPFRQQRDYCIDRFHYPDASKVGALRGRLSNSR